MKPFTEILIVLPLICSLNASTVSGANPRNPKGHTLSERIGNCHHFVLVECVKSDGAGTDDNAQTTCRIIDVVKSKGNAYKVGDEFRKGKFNRHESGIHHSMMKANPRLAWCEAGDTNETLWNYLKDIPPPAEDSAREIERAKRFLSSIAHKESAIAHDAYREVSALDYKSVRKIAKEVPIDRLRTWITDRERNGTDLKLFGLCMGFQGISENAELLEQIVLNVQPNVEYRNGIHGVMMGLVLLRGEQALDLLDEHKLRAPTFEASDGKEYELPFTEAYAVMQVLRLLWNDEPDLIPQERLKQSMRILLDRPILADLAISDLARWEDWSQFDRLMKIYDDKDFDIPIIKRSIIRFMYRCTQKAAADSKEVATAQKHLHTLKRKDPKLYRETARFFVR